MFVLILVACIASAAAAPVRWGAADTTALADLDGRARQGTFNGTDLAQARVLLRKYAPLTADNAEQIAANMTDEDVAAFRNRDAAKMMRILTTSYTACGDCQAEISRLDAQAQHNAGILYTFVVNFGLTLNSTVATEEFTRADRADVDELVIKARRGSFGESDLAIAWSLLRKYSPVTAARAEETIRKMSAEDKEAFKQKEGTHMMTIVVNSYKACGECETEASKLSTVDQMRVGKLYAFVINYVVVSSA